MERAWKIYYLKISLEQDTSIILVIYIHYDIHTRAKRLTKILGYTGCIFKFKCQIIRGEKVTSYSKAFVQQIVHRVLIALIPISLTTLLL